jgi:hypothetical protein
VSRRTLGVCAVAVLAGSTALSGSAGAAGEAVQTVTLAVERSEDPLTTNINARFTGTVSSGSPGEEVTVLQQTCGYGFATAVAGTQTKTGGFWEAVPTNSYVIALSATYTARWKNETSAPVAIRPEIGTYMTSLPNKRLKLGVSLGTSRQAMRGKTVVLERRRANRWRFYQRKKLTLDGGGRYAATFVVRRGWIVRGRVPAETAAPCFLATTTKKRRIR